MKNKKGSPNPIVVEKKCGDVSMAHIPDRPEIPAFLP